MADIVNEQSCWWQTLMATIRGNPVEWDASTRPPTGNGFAKHPNPTPDSRAAQSLLHLQTDGLVQYIPSDLINENKFRGDFLIHLWGHLIMSTTTPSPRADQNAQTDESMRDGSELDDRQLDDVSGGTGRGAGTTFDKGRPPPARTP